jgi:hypothetical protein
MYRVSSADRCLIIHYLSCVFWALLWFEVWNLESSESWGEKMVGRLVGGWLGGCWWMELNWGE